MHFNRKQMDRFNTHFFGFPTTVTITKDFTVCSIRGLSSACKTNMKTEHVLWTPFFVWDNVKRWGVEWEERVEFLDAISTPPP